MFLNSISLRKIAFQEYICCSKTSCHKNDLLMYKHLVGIGMFCSFTAFLFSSKQIFFKILLGVSPFAVYIVNPVC